jgi:pyruvate/2-oxoglutarate dehydrogenase complex dihydrolipoamide dehydrogenase (E3) component
VSYLEVILSESVPERAIVVGAGPIGIEFAYIWANYGVEVTMVEMLPRLLPNEDPEVSAVIERAYRKLGIKFFTDTVVESAEVTDDGYAPSCKTARRSRPIRCSSPLASSQTSTASALKAIWSWIATSGGHRRRRRHAHQHS